MDDWRAGLIDDLAVPRGRALPPALRAYVAARAGAHGGTLGCFGVTEHDLSHLRTGEVPLHLAVAGGAGALEAALRWVGAQPPGRVTLRRVSVRLRGEADLAHNARRVVTVLGSGSLPDDVEVHAAPPPPDGAPSAGWLGALDELAAREVGLLLPAGAGWTAGAVDAALDRELPMAFEADGAAGAVAAMTAVRTAFDGEAPASDWLDVEPDAATRTRRWCRAVLVSDGAAVAPALSS